MAKREAQSGKVGAKTPAKVTPFARLLGDVPVPKSDPDEDYRDAADSRGDAIVKAARLDPDRFFSVLEAETSLAGDSGLVWSLGFVRDPRAIPTLVRALADSSTNVRWSAANALSHYRGKAVVEALIAALSERSSNVLRSVVEALGTQRKAAAVAPLEELLARPAIRKSAPMRKLIEEALKKSGAKPAA